MISALESIYYYHPEIIERIAKKQSVVTGEKEEELISVTRSSAINAICLVVPKDTDTARIDREFFGPPTVNGTAIELLTIRR